MEATLTVFILFSCLAANIYSTYSATTDPTYLMVVGSKTLRPNSAYHVAVSMQPNINEFRGRPAATTSSTVRVSIEGPQDSGGIFVTSQTTTVEPFGTRIVKLEIGELEPGTYNLTAQTLDATIFRQSIQLEYVAKSYSVFIQTDKAIYKPGDLIRFRSVVLDKLLRPGVTGAIDVRITDGAGNRVKQWPRALTSKGVFTGELQLSESPVLGDWNITVVVLNQTFTKSFHVAEYVLPKFEVKVDTQKHATFSQGKIPITIHARYTYDRRVKGTVTVSAFPVIYSGVIQPIFQSPVRHVLPIDGEATVEIDVAEELKLGDEYERPVVIEAVVEEALTGRRQNGSTRIIVHKYPYRLQLFKSSEYFKPGIDYSAQIYVSKHDGTPAQGSVTIRHGFTYDSDAYNVSEHKLDINGMATLTFPTPYNKTVLGIEAQYEGLKEWFSAVMSASSPSGVYIQTTLLTKQPKINSDVEIRVDCTASISHVAYEVLGRGDILAANVARGTGTKSTIIRFPVTPSMTPTAHVIVHLVSDSGELLADALDFDIDGALQNFVELATSVEQTAPGKDVEITIKTKPNSYIGLLGIDQSVLALRSGNDLSWNDIEKELRSYDGGHESPYHNSEGEPAPLSWRPGSGTAYDAFNDAGAVILTNSEVVEMHPLLAAVGRSGGGGMVTTKPDRGPAVALVGATRPPLAGPYAFSRIPRPRLLWNQPRVFLSDNLPPEPTWLFSNMSSGFEGKTSLRRTVPDTITSWIITAFSVDPVWGLGLTRMPRKLRVFQPFFVSLDLPYAVRRGEIVAISIVVHNYLDVDVSTEVTFDNTEQDFEFAVITNEISEPLPPKIELYRKKKLKVPKNGGAGISFMVIPKNLGYVTVKVTATSSVAGDTVHRKLLVLAEGETQYMNKAVFVDLRQNKSFKSNLTLDIPKNVVSGSEYIEISAAGDILGPTIPNLDSLIRIPHGCGEQNMLNLVPNILVLDYLKNTKQLTPAIQNKAVKYMEVGYQQELTYRHPDGSFSAFGTSDPKGSVWLTAFVARSLRKAAAYIHVDETIIEEALNWIANNQAPNGSFPEVGKVSHQEMQGGASKGLALTAYTLVTFLEAGSRYRAKYSNAIDKAVDYIVRNLQEDDIYACAITAYALQLVSHPARNSALNLLETLANRTSDMKWWQQNVSVSERNNPWRAMPNSINIEITSYAMLALLQRGLVEDCLPILRWLVTQRNQNGGFSSTQDTVVGLQALAELGESISQGGSQTQIRIKYEYKPGTFGEISINPNNFMVLQKYELPKRTRIINITAEGNGFAVIQVAYKFNVNVTGAWPMFTLDPQVDRNSNNNHLQLSICSGFVGNPNDTQDSQSNMAVMEVSLPSGFTVDSDALPSLRASPHVKRVETREGNTQVVLYFDHMHRKQEYCPTVSAFRTHKVARQAPVPVNVYDYYDTARRARVFYEPRMATLRDICENEDCGNIYSTNADTQRSSDSKDNKDGAATIHIPAALLAVLLLTHLI